MDSDRGQPHPGTPGRRCAAVHATCAHFLTAAAERWPHVGPRLLYPLLRRDPALAVRAASPVLSSLAALDSIDLDVLEGIEAELPTDDVRLHTGAADVIARLSTVRLARAEPGLEQARLHERLSWAATRADREAEALAHPEEAVRLYRETAAGDPAQRFPYATALTRLGSLYLTHSQPARGVALLREAAGVLRAMGEDDPSAVAGLARLNELLAMRLLQAGQPDEALAVVQDTEQLYDRLSDRAAWRPADARCR